MPLNRIVMYVKDIDETVRFYNRFFGFTSTAGPGDRIVELTAREGATLLLHQAAKGHRNGQSSVKLVFDVADVQGFCRRAEEDGLKFGPIHHADGYDYANAKDPSLNPVSVSSRAFRST